MFNGARSFNQELGDWDVSKVKIIRYMFRDAEEFNQNKWMYAILGIVAYYVGTFIGGIVLAIFDELFVFGINWENSFSLGLIALPFGIATSYLFYFLLRSKWQKSVTIVKDEIQDIGKPLE